MSIGKFILSGGLGFVLFGPIGAVVGVLLASLGSSGTKNQKSRDTAPSDFRIVLLILVAAVMKADGEVKKSELNVVKQFLVKVFGEESALEALQLLKKILKEDFNVISVAVQVNGHLNYSQKTELIHLLFTIAYADHAISQAELNCILQISNTFRISSSDFNAIRATFMQGKDENWAYKVLEIERSATNDEVKKAYRRMAMKFHPDKVNTLGEDIKKQAEEKFKQVQIAYETIKEERNIA